MLGLRFVFFLAGAQQRQLQIVLPGQASSTETADEAAAADTSVQPWPRPRAVGFTRASISP